MPVLVLRPATLQHLEPVVAAIIDSSDDAFDIFLAFLAQEIVEPIGYLVQLSRELWLTLHPSLSKYLV